MGVHKKIYYEEVFLRSRLCSNSIIHLVELLQNDSIIHRLLNSKLIIAFDNSAKCVENNRSFSQIFFDKLDCLIIRSCRDFTL